MTFTAVARDRFLAALRWIRRRLRRSPLSTIAHADEILKQVARRTSCPVQEVSSRLNLPLDTVSGILAQLEQTGLVRVSRGSIASHRIVAITTKGREELKR